MVILPLAEQKQTFKLCGCKETILPTNFSAQLCDICILCSEDRNYSMNKGENILGLNLYQFGINSKYRLGSIREIDSTIERAKNEWKKYFVVIANMMTTM